MTILVSVLEAVGVVLVTSVWVLCNFGDSVVCRGILVYVETSRVRVTFHVGRPLAHRILVAM